MHISRGMQLFEMGHAEHAMNLKHSAAVCRTNLQVPFDNGVRQTGTQLLQWMCGRLSLHLLDKRLLAREELEVTCSPIHRLGCDLRR